MFFDVPHARHRWPYSSRSACHSSSVNSPSAPHLSARLLFESARNAPVMAFISAGVGGCQAHFLQVVRVPLNLSGFFNRLQRSQYLRPRCSGNSFIAHQTKSRRIALARLLLRESGRHAIRRLFVGEKQNRPDSLSTVIVPYGFVTLSASRPRLFPKHPSRTVPKSGASVMAYEPCECPT